MNDLDNCAVDTYAKRPIIQLSKRAGINKQNALVVSDYATLFSKKTNESSSNNFNTGPERTQAPLNELCNFA